MTLIAQTNTPSRHGEIKNRQYQPFTLAQNIPFFDFEPVKGRFRLVHIKYFPYGQIFPLRYRFVQAFIVGMDDTQFYSVFFIV